jgi:glycosyltransferase involved in cell wall biosynthesis
MVSVDNERRPLVSFVVNCYNGENYLDKCLSSILNQTYKDWELIFWDNSSEDKSKEIFFSYEDKRFKYFSSKRNVNLGLARKFAVEKCRGEYISFLDIDDEWIPEKTEIQVREMAKDDYALCYGGIVWVDEETKKRREVYPKYKSGYLFSENMRQFEINMPTAMIRASKLAEKNLNFDENIKASEEYCLFMQLLFNQKVCVINHPLATYLVRTNSLTNQSIQHWADERIYTLNKIIDQNPESLIDFPKEFEEAFARAEFYKLRYHLSMNRVHKAKRNALKIYKSNLKYFVITFLLFCSPRLLKYIFKRYYDR